MKIVTKPVPSGHPLTFPFVYIQCEKGLCSLLSCAVTFYYFYCLHNLDEGSEKNLEFVMSYGFIEKLVKNPSCWVDEFIIFVLLILTLNYELLIKIKETILYGKIIAKATLWNWKLSFICLFIYLFLSKAKIETGQCTLFHKLK